MSKQPLDQQFQDILKLYDFADELIETVDSTPLRFETIGNVVIHCKEAQYELVSELIDDIALATDVLTESFTEIAENNGKAKHIHKMKVEGALRRLFAAIDAYKQRSTDLAPRLFSDSEGKTTGIVGRLKDAAGHVVAIFINYVDISVERIMHKAEIDDLKRKEVDVAFALHKANQTKGH